MGQYFDGKTIRQSIGPVLAIQSVLSGVQPRQDRRRRIPDQTMRFGITQGLEGRTNEQRSKDKNKSS
jgi:hypothetical protein